MISIRPWTHSDLDPVLALTDLEHWGFVRADLERLMSLAPGGCLLVDEGGRQTATTTLVRYGEEAWIGTVLVHPDRRGQGLGAKIVGEALQRARAAGVRTVRIHSYARTQAFYEGLGFEREKGMTAVRYSTSPARVGPLDELIEVGPLLVRPMAARDLEDVVEMDRRLFGSCRDRLIEGSLEEFPGLAHVAEVDGCRVAAFAQARGGTGGIELGPLAIDPEMDVEKAAHLGRALCRPIMQQAEALDESVELSCYRANRQACALFSNLGFVEGFETVQMVFGEKRRGPDPMGIWALCALEKG